MKKEFQNQGRILNRTKSTVSNYRTNTKSAEVCENPFSFVVTLL